MMGEPSLNSTRGYTCKKYEQQWVWILAIPYVYGYHQGLFEDLK